MTMNTNSSNALRTSTSIMPLNRQTSSEKTRIASRLGRRPVRRALTEFGVRKSSDFQKNMSFASNMLATINTSDFISRYNFNPKTMKAVKTDQDNFSWDLLISDEQKESMEEKKQERQCLFSLPVNPLRRESLRLTALPPHTDDNKQSEVASEAENIVTAKSDNSEKDTVRERSPADTTAEPTVPVVTAKEATVTVVTATSIPTVTSANIARNNSSNNSKQRKITGEFFSIS